MGVHENDGSYSVQAFGSGVSLASLGAVCVVAGGILSLLFDLNDSNSPAVGAPGMMAFGAIFIVVGGLLAASAPSAK